MSDLIDRAYGSVCKTVVHGMGAGTCGLVGGVVGAVLAMPFLCALGKVDVLTKPWWIGVAIGVVSYGLNFADE